MSGLSDTGLVIETFETLVDSMSLDFVEETGVAFDAVGPQAPDGILIRIIADRLASLWEGIEQVYTSDDPDTNSGAAQDATCALTGTIREPAAPSRFTEADDNALLFVGTATTVIAINSNVSSSSTLTVWETIEEVTLAATTAWTQPTAYVVGDIRANSGNVYFCITAGTSAAGGPTTESLDITDGTVHWAFAGTGTGHEYCDATSVETGVLSGLAYTINTIDTPISGWDAVFNPYDATVGREIETDAELRVRRSEELTSSGTATPAAIREDILDIESVTSCTVFYNNTDTTDADGIPPHSVEVMIQGGVDQDIIDQLFLSVAAGIATYGSTSGTATDSQGTDHAMSFTRPTAKTVYVEITVHVDADLYPADGDTLVKEKIVEYGDALPAGRDVRARPIGAAVTSRTDEYDNEQGVAGVIDAPSVKIKLTAAPTVETTIPIALREISTYDTSRITVVVVGVTP